VSSRVANREFANRDKLPSEILAVPLGFCLLENITRDIISGFKVNNRHVDV